MPPTKLAPDSLPTRQIIRFRDSNEWKKLTWGVISVLFGLITILMMLRLEEAYHPTKYHIFLELMGHLGIAGLLLGVVGIFLEFKNWSVYFEERLANIIQKREFLRTLEDDQKLRLLKDVFLALYKVEEFDRDSFHDFLSTKIQKFVGDPFREDTRSVMTVSAPDKDGSFQVLEDLRYTCRKVPGRESTLQSEIQLKFDKSDLVRGIAHYRISLCLPEQLPAGFSIPGDFKPFLKKNEREIVFESSADQVPDMEKERLKKALLETDDDHYGFTISLRAFESLESLDVHQCVTYALQEERFLAWSSSYLSLGFEVIINYPKDVFTVQLEHFGMDDRTVTIVNQPGVYSLKYDSWLLPQSGVAFRCIANPNVRNALILEQALMTNPAPRLEGQHARSQSA